MLELELPLEGAETVSEASVTLEHGVTTVWPRNQPTHEMADPRIIATRFSDTQLIQRELTAGITAQAARQPRNRIALGGTKVRELAIWNLPASKLICQRALLLFCRARGDLSAHIVDCWMNVMYHGEYSKPHCHYDAEGAVVYALEFGDPDPGDPSTGRLELIDSRIPACNSARPDHPTRGLLPDMIPGSMLYFPASFLHFVHPYQGQRPRITFAFNISPGKAPEDRTAVMAQGRPGDFVVSHDGSVPTFKQDQRAKELPAKEN